MLSIAGRLRRHLGFVLGLAPFICLVVVTTIQTVNMQTHLNHAQEPPASFPFHQSNSAAYSLSLAVTIPNTCFETSYDLVLV